MNFKQTSCAKYTGLILVLHLLPIRSANGEGVCTKLKYGTAEDGYMPVLVKYCCPGYGGVNTTQCLPRCDNGCPPNSQCVIPNVCECDTGYEVDETVLYYGLTAIKSCRSKGFSTLAVSVAGSVLSVLAIVTALIALMIYLRKGQKESQNICEKNRLQDLGPIETDV